MSSRKEYFSGRIDVPSEFQEVFSYFYVAKNNSKERIHKTLLPNYQTLLLFNFGGELILSTNSGMSIEVDKCIVIGPIKQSFDYSIAAGSEIVVANFKDDAFYRFFGQSAVSGKITMHPDDLMDENCFTILWQLLKKIGTQEERVSIILSFCKPYLRNRTNAFEVISNQANANEALNPVKTIADKTQQSERNVQLNYKKYLGFSAKEINRYKRFLRAVGLLQDLAASSRKADWFYIIEECNYYDQSQLIHDFKHYLNLTPTQFFKFQEEVCIPDTK